MACYNTIIPYLCPELPAQQKEALSYAERVPLIYTNVAIRNWKAFQKLGVWRIQFLNGYFSMAEMDFPVSMGDYHFTDSPDQPCVLHMLRTPCRYGVPAKEQYRAVSAGTCFGNTFFHLRAEYPRPVGTRAGARRLRSGQGYPGHHGESLGAWLRI